MAGRYIIELGGLIQEIHGHRLRPLRHPCDTDGDAWLVSDLEQTLTRVDRVDAPPRYAEMVVRKRLQDAGEFTEPVVILTHWKKKVSKDRSDIYYTAVPEYLVQQYERQLKDCTHNVLLFPVHAVLWSALRSLPGRQTSAVVFAHDRFAELLIGDRGQAHAALRITAYDTGGAALEALWESVHQELAQNAERLHVKVKRVLGFSWQMERASFERHLEQTAERLDAEPLLLPVRPLEINGEQVEDSLPEALASLRTGYSISPRPERLAYTSQRAAPWATLAAVAAVTGLVGTGWWMTERADRLQTGIADLERRIEASPVSDLPPAPPYQETMAFAETLARLSDGHVYRALINDLSAALPEDLQIDALRISHEEDVVQLEVFGSAMTGFRAAQYGHQGFLAGLRLRGYRVKEQQFSTRIGASDFRVSLEMPRT